MLVAETTNTEQPNKTKDLNFVAKFLQYFFSINSCSAFRKSLKVIKPNFISNAFILQQLRPRNDVTPVDYSPYMEYFNPRRNKQPLFTNRYTQASFNYHTRAPTK